ncbi:MAG: hypothetical protein CME07_01800, partial [Gemmatimonadetes bacterium]|nr:hypothetical protein [Gemmatimonadota bacterium]
MGGGPWGGERPKAPKAGAGREALGRSARARRARRAKARGGGETRRAAAAARRGLRRERGRRGAGRMAALLRPVVGVAAGTAAKLAGYARVSPQGFLGRQRLRWVVLALGGVWVVWTFFLSSGSLPRLWSVRGENRALNAEIHAMEARADGLRAEVAGLAAAGGEDWREVAGVAGDAAGAADDAAAKVRPPTEQEAREALERVARDEHAMVGRGETL